MTRYEITKTKVLTSGLKVTYTDYDLEESTFKLTLTQWEFLTHRKLLQPVDHKTWPTLAGRSSRRAYPSNSGTMTALRLKGFFEHIRDAPYVSPYDKAGKRESRTAYDVATPFGEAMIKQLAHVPCPSREHWPKRTSNGAPRLTSHQKKVMSEWPTYTSQAVPLGSNELSRGRWVVPSNGNERKTLNALLRHGYVELGVEGINIVGGKLEVSKAEWAEPRIAYRLTVLGGLIAGSALDG